MQQMQQMGSASSLPRFTKLFHENEKRRRCGWAARLSPTTRLCCSSPESQGDVRRTSPARSAASVSSCCSFNTPAVRKLSANAINCPGVSTLTSVLPSLRLCAADNIDRGWGGQ